MPARTVILRPNPFDGLPSVIVVVMTILVLLGVDGPRRRPVGAIPGTHCRRATRRQAIRAVPPQHLCCRMIAAVALAPEDPPGASSSAPTSAGDAPNRQDRRTLAAVTDRLPTTDR